MSVSFHGNLPDLETIPARPVKMDKNPAWPVMMSEEDRRKKMYVFNINSQRSSNWDKPKGSKCTGVMASIFRVVTLLYSHFYESCDYSIVLAILRVVITTLS